MRYHVILHCDCCERFLQLFFSTPQLAREFVFTACFDIFYCGHTGVWGEYWPLDNPAWRKVVNID